ncbi:MAG: hydrogenase maturation protease [Bryobacteraceae bacterium]
MKTIIVGIGNPVLSDDGVGLEIARRLAGRLAGRDDVDVVQMYGGGLRLMEALAGYQQAIVIDAIVTGGPPGTIHGSNPGTLWTGRHIHSTHDANLPMALDLGRAAGLSLPAEIRIWAVEAADVETVREGLSPMVEEAVPAVVERVVACFESACLERELEKP